jgi:hypothetical protein
MKGYKLKILICLALSLAFLLAPFALDFTPTGNAYALAGGGGAGSNHPAPKATIQRAANGYTMSDEETGPPISVPEPGTLLLLGLGVAGLAIFRRKKFMK